MTTNRDDQWWVITPRHSVPERFTARAMEVSLIPLTPGEAQGMLTSEALGEQEDLTDLAIIQLLARGQTIATIARRLGMGGRTVDTRVARLRDRMGVSSTSELACLLARRGF